MQIGELSKITGLSRDTLRYYEKYGLLPSSQFQYQNNSQNNYRSYKNSVVVRIQQIRDLKNIGFSLEEIHYLLNDLNPDDPCRDLPKLLTEKIAIINNKIDQLQKFRLGLETSLKVCTDVCSTKPSQIAEQMPQCLNQSVKIYSPDSFSSD